MNLIAHLFLSAHSQDLSIGNLLGDIVRGSDLSDFPTEVQQGIRLHRAIDTFTDLHPIVKKSTSILHHGLSKAAPVVVDVLYDYLLFKNWNTFTSRSFDEFKEEQYRWIQESEDFGLPHFAKLKEHLVEEDWLKRYTYPDGLVLSYQLLERRAKFNNSMGSAWGFIQPHLAEFDQHFLEFFPDLIQHVQDFLNPN